MKKKALAWILGTSILTAGGVGYYVREHATQAEAFTYKTAEVERGRVEARVTATGTLSAHVTVQVGSQVSGRLQQIMVDFNSPVKKGDVIAKIDPQIFEASAAQARANLLAANGNLIKAKAQSADAQRKYDRAKALAAEGLASKNDLETAETTAESAKAEIEAAKGSVEQARAALHQAQVNLGYTTIVSPIDGVVISRSVDVGQTVAASLQAPTLFTIAEDLRQMQVDTNIAESDVGKLGPGMTATFVVDAYPNRRFQGKIRQIRNAPQTVQNVVTYDAVIDVDNEDLALKPGMTANVTIVYADERDAVIVPNAALRFRPPPGFGAPPASAGAKGSGEAAAAARPRATSSSEARPAAAPGEGASTDLQADRRALWVLRGGHPDRVRVRIGVSDGTVTQIVEGDVKPGDSVITEASGGGSTPGAGASRPPGGGRFRL
jgi:HlyD family secretion protein